MPLCNEVNIERFRQDIAGKSFVLFNDVPLPEEHFARESGSGSDILLKARSGGSSFILLIASGVSYSGPDPALRNALAALPHRGWHTVAVIGSDAPAEVLRRTDEILGMNGAAPSLARRPSPAEIVVKADQIDPQERNDDSNGVRFGANLVAEARAGRLVEPLFRDKELDALVRILCKSGKNAACLVGPPGAGKTSVVEGLAIRIARGEVPPILKDAQILDVNLSMLAAGAVYRNEFEGRVKKLLELARQDPGVILFLDELHTISGPASDASQMVKSDLGRGRIRCIGATTNAEWRILEKDAALARRFQVVPVDEPSPAQTIEILHAARERLETHHRIRIPDDLIVNVVNLAVRYVPDRQLPDKALDLLDEACACVRIGAAVPARVPPEAARSAVAPAAEPS